MKSGLVDLVYYTVFAGKHGQMVNAVNVEDGIDTSEEIQLGNPLNKGTDALAVSFGMECP